MECIELNKPYERSQKQPSSHSCTELSKTKFFPVLLISNDLKLSKIFKQKPIIYRKHDTANH